VLNILKETDVSRKYTTLVNGEGLFNDGTVVAFFHIITKVIYTGKLNFWESMLKFFRLSVGGPIFGILVGWISSRWIRSIHRDHTLIVLITVFFTYLMFLLCENYIDVSGSLALVSMGIFLSQFTKVNLSHRNLHAVHTMWAFFGFVLETTIFFITGTFIGDLFTKLETIKLGGDDVIKGLLFIPVLNLIRYLVMLIQLPVLNKIGFPISCTSALILSYGGLRGAIALSLAMLVFVDPLLSVDLRHLCLYYVVVIIAFTVCINGMTIKVLMKLTGFLDVDPIKDKMKNNVLRKILISAFQFKDEILKKDTEL
jgi:NhaP-type Na+/H+ or K+/H+ antiporter